MPNTWKEALSTMFVPDPDPYRYFTAVDTCPAGPCPGCDPEAFGLADHVVYALRAAGFACRIDSGRRGPTARVVDSGRRASTARVVFATARACAEAWALLERTPLWLASDGPTAIRVAPRGGFLLEDVAA